LRQPLSSAQTDRLVAERFGQERQVLADQLFLQVDRIGGNDGPFAVGCRPAQRRNEIA
jgi:predicted ATPase